MLNLALVISAWIRKSRKSHGHRCIVKPSNDLDARGVVLTWHHSFQLQYGSLKESDCQRCNINLTEAWCTV